MPSCTTVRHTADGLESKPTDSLPVPNYSCLVAKSTNLHTVIYWKVVSEELENHPSAEYLPGGLAGRGHLGTVELHSTSAIIPSSRRISAPTSLVLLRAPPHTHCASAKS